MGRTNVTGFEDEQFVNEDEQVKTIENLEDPDEQEAAQKLLKEEIDNLPGPGEEQETPGSDSKPDADRLESEKETLESKKESEEEKAKGKDEKSAGESEEAKKAEEEAKKRESDNEILITDEVIKNAPEKDKAILERYKGKPIAEIEKAIANAYLTKNNKDLLKTLVEAQRDVGKQPDLPAEKSTEHKAEDYSKLPEKLPEIPDRPEIKKLIDTRTVAKLRKQYPDLPDNLDDLNSPELTEYIRDLTDDDFRKVSKFTKDLEEATNISNREVQEALYYNQNYRKINNSRLIKAVEKIKETMEKKWGIKDFDQMKDGDDKPVLDLNLVQDENGSLFNDEFNKLFLNGKQPDPSIISFKGNLPIIEEDNIQNLVDKFLNRHTIDIISYVVNNQNKSDQNQIEKVKESNLNTIGNEASPGNKGSESITSESIIKLADNDEARKAEMNKLKSFFSNLPE